MTHVTCRLTANNRDQLWNPALGNRVWATFTFTDCARRWRRCMERTWNVVERDRSCTGFWDNTQVAVAVTKWLARQSRPPTVWLISGSHLTADDMQPWARAACYCSLRSTQPRIPSGSLNRAPASDGVTAGIRLCRVAGNTVWFQMACALP